MKKTVSLILCFSLIFTIFGISVYADNNSADISNGLTYKEYDYSTSVKRRTSVSSIKKFCETRLENYSEWIKNNAEFTLECPKKNVSDLKLIMYLNDISNLLKGKIGKQYAVCNIVFNYSASNYKSFSAFSNKLFSLKEALNYQWSSWGGYNRLGFSLGSSWSGNNYQLQVSLFVNGSGNDGFITATESEKDVREYHNKLMSIYKNAKDYAGTDKFKLVYYFCWWLDNNIKYKFVFDNSPINAFADGYTVCGGYANALKDLCNLAGIPALVPTNDKLNHAWNQVYLNGEWYTVDLCNVVNSVGGSYYYKYLFKDPDATSDNVQVENSIKKQLITPTPFFIDYKNYIINKKINISHFLGGIKNAEIKVVSSNKDIISVSGNTILNPKKCGKTTLTVSVNQNGKSYVIKKTLISIVPKTPKASFYGGKGKIKAVYKKSDGATGFQVELKKGSKTNFKKFNTKSNAVKFIENLNKGNYSVRMRAFCKSNDKTGYSLWTKSKTIKVT
ncbi:MAG: transglutaminase domain-containing protein [Acutalibacteraceae bacterium]|nr:transglutaminase domain-containing protein [Acutalibacteraceae bacterium]